MTHPARQTILDRIASVTLPSVPLPEIDASRLQRFDDRIGHFASVLAGVGGQCHRVDDTSSVASILQSQPEYLASRWTMSLVPGVVPVSDHDVALDDPHSLAEVEWAIVPGRFGVVENAAVWVEGADLPHRSLVFLAQYLVLVVPADSLVDHMHQAYDRLHGRQAGFGIFVSGPSKTADIEQSLVIGAHGCRGLQVFLT